MAAPRKQLRTVVFGSPENPDIIKQRRTYRKRLSAFKGHHDETRAEAFYASAREKYVNAVKEEFGESSIQLADLYAELAEEDRYSPLQLEFLKLAVAMYQACLGDQDLTTIRCMIHLGQCLIDHEEDISAHAYLCQALKILEAINPDNAAYDSERVSVLRRVAKEEISRTELTEQEAISEAESAQAQPASHETPEL